MQSTFPQRRRKPPTGAKQRKLFRTALGFAERGRRRLCLSGRTARRAHFHPPHHKIVFPTQLPHAPKRSPPEGTSPPLCGAKRLVSPSSATAAAFSIPAISPTTINAAIRTPARRSALGFAERGRRRLSPPPGSAFQAEPRAAPTSHKKCRP